MLPLVGSKNMYVFLEESV